MNIEETMVGIKNSTSTYSVFKLYDDEKHRILVKDENESSPYSIVAKIEYKNVGEEYKSCYLSWYNFILCSNSFYVAHCPQYTNYAVQSGKKIAATAYPANKAEYEDILKNLPNCCEAIPYEDGTIGDYPHILYVCRKGCLKDYFDLRQIRRIYDKHETFKEKELNWGKVEELFAVPLHAFASPSKTDINLQTATSNIEYLIIGLLFGYPIESTIAYIKKTELTALKGPAMPFQKEEIAKNGYCYDGSGKNKLFMHGKKLVAEWQRHSLYFD